MTLSADHVGRSFTVPAPNLSGSIVPTQGFIGEYHIAEYVFAPDDFAGRGILSLLSQQGKTGVRITDEGPLHSKWALHMHDYRLTVVIPPEPLAMLRMIRRIAGLVKHSSRPPRILVLSPVPASWLIRTLMALACSAGMLSEVTVLPGRTDCKTLATALSVKRGLVTPVGVLPDAGNWNPVLTPTEYRAVMNWLAGIPAKVCAEHNGGSVKTVYLHRHHGRRKLGQLFPQLLPRRVGSDSGS